MLAMSHESQAEPCCPLCDLLAHQASFILIISGFDTQVGSFLAQSIVSPTSHLKALG